MSLFKAATIKELMVMNNLFLSRHAGLCCQYNVSKIDPHEDPVI